MILIAVYNSDGCIGRCDAKCYNAKTPEHACDCVCGGRNHGAGIKKAEENTRDYADTWIENYKQRKGLQDDVSSEINPDIFQLRMF